MSNYSMFKYKHTQHYTYMLPSRRLLKVTDNPLHPKMMSEGHFSST